MSSYLLINFSDIINDAIKCRLMTQGELKIELCKDSIPSDHINWRNSIFFNTTHQISSALKNGHCIRQIWICYIIQFGMFCNNLSMKKDVNRLRASKIFWMLSDKWHDVDMRQSKSEKPDCSGNGV